VGRRSVRGVVDLLPLYSHSLYINNIEPLAILTTLKRDGAWRVEIVTQEEWW
jgi:hypothetical protein